MYKFLLCWRYLRTRYIALASIVSVMLGVATMIVVNAVMAGFTHEMEDRIHGILSDVIVASRSLEGAPNAEWHMQQIQEIAGEHIAGMSPTAHVPALLSFQVAGQFITKQVNLIGIDQATYASVSDFGRYLQHPENRRHLDFQLKQGGYDTVDHQAGDPSAARPRPQMEHAGWPRRRLRARLAPAPVVVVPETSHSPNPFGEAGLTRLGAGQGAAGAPDAEAGTANPPEPLDGCVLGIALSQYLGLDGSEMFTVLPGDDVKISFLSAGTPPKIFDSSFTVVDFYESKMNEYDASFVFVPIHKLQDLRGMIDPSTGVANFNSIQIRLKPGVDLDAFRDILRHHELFPPQNYIIETWRDRQGPLLAAVQMEIVLLNILLFLIVAVAGFGILAIFFMIVVEKTRDIGILKSLGASGSGVMGIFLSYGLGLGIVGAGVGMAMGLLFVHYINEIADVLGWISGHEVFDPSIYYFHSIPTIVQPLTVSWIVMGAVTIAVLASILPAWRAARLHPVEALRYE